MRVAVLGGGPAGAAAALRLASAGVYPTLFRPERPGEKPCGGALPGYLLDEVPGVSAAGLPSTAVDRARLENAAGASLEIDLSSLLVFRRGDLDPALVEAARRAGAEVRSTKVRRLDWVSGRPRLWTDADRSTFDWIIGADGARGLSRRSLGITPRGESVGLGASIEGLPADTLVLAFPDRADSYLWIFPRPGGCSVGIAYTQSRLSPQAAKACLSSFLERHLSITYEQIEGCRYRYPIPVFGDWVRGMLERGLERRVLLAGDAAAVADPLTREGIRYAVRSGRWAADALLSGRPERYASTLCEQIEGDLGRASRARELFFEGPIGQWMVPVCRRHAGIRRVLGDLLKCAQPYTGLRRRLLGAAVGLTLRSDSPSGPAP